MQIKMAVKPNERNGPARERAKKICVNFAEATLRAERKFYVREKTIINSKAFVYIILANE